MAIAESQLALWAQGISTTAHLDAQAQIARAFAASPLLQGRTYDVFAHGSYRTGTVIHPDTPVDLIAQLNESYYDDLTELPADQKKLVHDTGETTARFASWTTFNTQIIQALKARYGALRLGAKAIRLSAASGRPPLHLVVGYQYRRYTKYTPFDVRFAEGVLIFLANHHSLASFPKLHCDNSAKRNLATAGGFKTFVRIVKHLRAQAIAARQLDEAAGSSYHLEGLLWNAPDALLSARPSQAGLKKLLEHLQHSDVTRFKAVNGIQPLCGESAWPVPDARRVLDALSAVALSS